MTTCHRPFAMKNGKLITKLSPGQADIFIKILLAANSPSIAINNSKIAIAIEKNSTWPIIYADFNNIFNKPVNLNFEISKEVKKALQTYKGNKPLKITQNGQEYVWENDMVKFKMTKSKVASYQDSLERMELKTIAEQKIDICKTIKAQNKQKYYDFLVKDQEITRIRTESGITFFIDDSAGCEGQWYRSKYFLQIVDASMILRIQKSDDKFYLLNELEIAIGHNLFLLTPLIKL